MLSIFSLPKAASFLSNFEAAIYHNFTASVVSSLLLQYYTFNLHFTLSFEPRNLVLVNSLLFPFLSSPSNSRAIPLNNTYIQFQISAERPQTLVEEHLVLHHLPR